MAFNLMDGAFEHNSPCITLNFLQLDKSPRSALARCRKLKSSVTRKELAQLAVMIALLQIRLRAIRYLPLADQVPGEEYHVPAGLISNEYSRALNIKSSLTWPML